MPLLIAFLSSSLVVAHVSAPACVHVSQVHFDRVADLPAGILAAFGAPMAEKGRPFQATDLVDKLPIYRFQSAEQHDCTLQIAYEHGGRGYGSTHATFRDDGSGWRLVGHRFYRDRRRGD